MRYASLSELTAISIIQLTPWLAKVFAIATEEAALKT